MNIVEARCAYFDEIYCGTTIHPEEEEAESSSKLRVADEVITKMEIDLACAAEKLVNLSIRMMHASIKETELEAFALTTTCSSCDSVGCDSMETLEFDLMCRIVESQVTEVELFIKNVEQNMMQFEAHKHNYNLGKIFIAMEERLCDAEESLKQSQDQILEIREQSTKFKRTLYHLNLGRLLNWNDNNNNKDKEDSKLIESSDEHCIGQFSDNNKAAKIKMQTAKQQKRILRMLEKSLEREMDLEKKLTESKQIEKDLKHTLISTQKDLSFTQEQVSQACERWFEAQNTTEIFKGISKELLHHHRFTEISSPIRSGESTTTFEGRSDEVADTDEISEEEEEEEEEMMSLELNSDDTHLSDVVSDKLSSSEEDDIEDEEKLFLANNYHTIQLDGWTWGCDFKFGNLK